MRARFFQFRTTVCLLLARTGAGLRSELAGDRRVCFVPTCACPRCGPLGLATSGCAFR